MACFTGNDLTNDSTCSPARQNKEGLVIANTGSPGRRAAHLSRRIWSCKGHEEQLAQWFQAVVGPGRRRTDFATAEARQKICLTCHSKAGRSGRRAVSLPKQGRQKSISLVKTKEADQAEEQLTCRGRSYRAGGRGLCCHGSSRAAHQAPALLA